MYEIHIYIYSHRDIWRIRFGLSSRSGTHKREVPYGLLTGCTRKLWQKASLIYLPTGLLKVFICVIKHEKDEKIPSQFSTVAALPFPFLPPTCLDHIQRAAWLVFASGASGTSIRVCTLHNAANWDDGQGRNGLAGVAGVAGVQNCGWHPECCIQPAFCLLKEFEMWGEVLCAQTAGSSVLLFAFVFLFFVAQYVSGGVCIWLCRLISCLVIIYMSCDNLYHAL